MSSYEDLEVYRLAHEMGIACHRLSLLLPKHEMYESGSQLRRASKSVSANIVEGYARRRYKAEYIRFLIFAHASLEESIEWLQYIIELYEDISEKAKSLKEKGDVVGAKLNRFIQAVELKHRSGTPEKEDGRDALP